MLGHSPDSQSDLDGGYVLALAQGSSILEALAALKQRAATIILHVQGAGGSGEAGRKLRPSSDIFRSPVLRIGDISKFCEHVSWV